MLRAVVKITYKQIIQSIVFRNAKSNLKYKLYYIIYTCTREYRTRMASTADSATTHRRARGGDRCGTCRLSELLGFVIGGAVSRYF